MKEAIILWGSVLMVGLAIVVFTLIMNWRANRYNEREQAEKDMPASV
jgi:hypothetical protein